MTTHLTPAAKETLRKTIRGLRTSLITQLKEEAEREYRLGVPSNEAKLPEARAKRRERLEAWAEEQSRAEAGAALETKSGSRKKLSEKALNELRERHLLVGVKEAAHTLVNRLVMVRMLEVGGLSKPAVVSGGWNSAGYREYQEYAQALCADPGDDTKGYRSLLQLVFDELSIELPGLYGKVGLTSLFSVPAATLREAVEALNEPTLDTAWGDDTTLGWVYQFWNDPEREALDDKINGGGKIEPHEIASKTQMFTERYMVEWLLQNSLGQTWLAMCKKHGWTPDFESVRADLDARRADWRAQREAGTVAPDALMPILSPLEEQWKYWVPQPMPEDAPAAAPNSVNEIKLLDPACGSGHFLVIAFDLLGALYLEEARHKGAQISFDAIATSIIEDNLYGIDIDPRAIQIAAAALWLKAKLWLIAQGEKGTTWITRINLVAPHFKLAGLSADDPALLSLQKRLKAEAHIDETLTTSLVEALSGVDHLGTLLRVDKSVRQALNTYEKEFFKLGRGSQMGLFGEAPKEKIQLSLDEAQASVMEQLAQFLEAHGGEGDLGLRLEGEQLAAGVRFLQIAKEGSYDVVVGNPPYQGTSKMAEAAWFKKHYPRSKADLYACFLERGLELAKPGGVSALLTMRGWMFLSSYQDVREHLLKEYDLRSIGDFDRGAFDDVPNEVLSVCVCAFRKAPPDQVRSIAAQPTPFDDKSYDRQRTGRKRGAVLAQVGRFEFDVARLAGIEGTPLVYWWDEKFLAEYVKAPKLGDVYDIKQGLCTGDNTRLLRLPWESARGNMVSSASQHDLLRPDIWVPFIKGGEGRAWFEPLSWLLNWRCSGLEIRAGAEADVLAARPQNLSFYAVRGVAIQTLGSEFAARIHRYSSVFGDMARSVFAPDLGSISAQLNSSKTAGTMSSLNPGVHFTVGDLKRLPVEPDPLGGELYSYLIAAFTLHESHREPSVEFKQPGASPWRYAQDWAQRAVDRPKGEPLPVYEEQLDPPEPASFVSFAIGVALGRFGENGEGIVDLSLATRSTQEAAAQKEAPQAQARALSDAAGLSLAGAQNKGSTTDSVELDVPNIEPSPLPEGQVILPEGILFISAAPNVTDSSAHPAYVRIEEAWDEQAALITAGKKTSLNEWLRKDFFAYHKSLYESRPIYFPLSSRDKSFVAWLSIHRWADNTLQALLSSHLHPAKQKLDGEINDLNQARASSDKKAQANAEKQYAKSQKLLDELDDFIAAVTQIAEKGAPPIDEGKKGKSPPREVDAPFMMDLDDGVMINSAALWPLLEAQWKDPKKWWKELATADGRKDYDWAHLSARYFPQRVDDKCKTDPSLAVAHGCFWKYHPAKAYAWELRLQDEIGPEFTIDEDRHWSDGGTWDGDNGSWDAPTKASDLHREAFLRDHPDQVNEIRAKEEQRRERKRNKEDKAETPDPADFSLTLDAAT